MAELEGAVVGNQTRPDRRQQYTEEKKVRRTTDRASEQSVVPQSRSPSTADVAAPVNDGPESTSNNKTKQLVSNHPSLCVDILLCDVVIVDVAVTDGTDIDVLHAGRRGMAVRKKDTLSLGGGVSARGGVEKGRRGGHERGLSCCPICCNPFSNGGGGDDQQDKIGSSSRSSHGSLRARGVAVVQQSQLRSPQLRSESLLLQKLGTTS
ncbi:hypothetical protein CBL_05615 [Carabus blaptoides fortunei]